MNPNAVTTIVGKAGEYPSGAVMRAFIGGGVDARGNLYFMDMKYHEPGWGHAAVLRKISPSGTLSTLAGDPNDPASPPWPRDGQGSAARFSRSTSALALDSSGNVYVADGNSIRKVTPGGLVSTLLNGLLASGIAVDTKGTIYVSTPGSIRMIRGGVVTLLAGSLTEQGSGDGIGAAARFNNPSGLSVDSAGNVFVADSGNNTIRRIDVAQRVTTIAGAAGVSGDIDGRGPAARFSGLSSLTLDSSGALYVSSSSGQVLRRIDNPNTKAKVTTVAGYPGSVGAADGIANKAAFGMITGLATRSDKQGNQVVYAMDLETVRKVGCAPEVVNGSFELPILAPGGYQYSPSGSDWSFTGGAGIQANSSAWGAPAAPDGRQTAFLQNAGAQIGQTVHLPAGRYSVSFFAARRAGQIQPIQVVIDGASLGTPITPASNAFASYATPAVLLAAGRHTVELRSAGSGPDNSSFIDAVALTQAATQRFGLTFGVPSTQSPAPGLAQLSCHGLPATLDNPYRGSCNPYVGDTSCSASLPVACFDPATGELFASNDSVTGTGPGFRTAAAEACQATRGGRMAEFHDFGGWSLQGSGGLNITGKTRYWVHINDQPANCWDR